MSRTRWPLGFRNVEAVACRAASRRMENVREVDYSIFDNHLDRFAQRVVRARTSGML